MKLWGKLVVALIAFCATSSPATAKEMSFHIIYGNHSNYVVADGEITDRTPSAFQVFLDSEPFDGFVFYIDLNSEGGSLLAGMQLGRMIRQQGLASRVVSYSRADIAADVWRPKERPGECYSACALAFLGGEHREIPDGSTIGFHQFSSAPLREQASREPATTESLTQFVSGIVHDYLQSMEIEPQLFTKLSQTLPNDMFIPTFEELRKLNIVSQVGFSNFILLPYKDGVMATASFKANAQGRNIVSKVTAFCREGEPYLLLSQPETYKPRSQDWLDSVNRSLSGFGLYDPKTQREIEFPKPAVTPLLVANDVAELRIGKDGAEMIAGGANGSVYIAAFVLMQFSITPTESDESLLEAAFRICTN